jgi:hypothetical protein
VTGHSHAERVPGCFRCDPTRDEVTRAARDIEYANRRDARAAGEFAPEPDDMWRWK